MVSCRVAVTVFVVQRYKDSGRSNVYFFKDPETLVQYSSRKIFRIPGTLLNYDTLLSPQFTIISIWQIYLPTLDRMKLQGVQEVIIT